jgi:POT family proton-dependent oligopeptide transporter
MAMNIQSSPAESKVGVGTIALLSGLVVPFNVAYAQMATTFIVQGSVMTNFGVVDAPMMNNADAVSVLAFGYIIGNVIYPELNRRGIKIPTTYKFAIGSAFGALAVGCAILTDYRIHQVYEESGEAITVLWQVFPYFLIGIGEIFAVSAAYELAFTVAPSKMKSVASAANLFMVGGLPNVVCIMLYNACRGWFLNKHGEARIHKLHDYASAKVVNYFWLVEAIALFGVVINILPSVKNWVESIEETAAESINSPISTPVIRKKLMQKKQYRSQHSSLGSSTEEETPLINSQKHANFLKYTERPELRKMGSFRAGPSSKSKKSGPAVLPQYQHRLLKSPEAKEQLYLQVNNAFAPHAADATGNKST